MLVNYILIAIRNLRKNTLFSLVNIAGMAISLVTVFVIALFVRDELSFDDHVEDADRKYRIYNARTSDDGSQGNYAIVPYPFASYMAKDYPEIESTARIMDTFGELLFEAGDKRIEETKGIYAEPGIVDMLSMQFISGRAETALTEPNNVVLTETLARKYFGATEVTGKELRISKTLYHVSGVIRDLPATSHLDVNYLLSFVTLTQNWAPVRYDNFVNQQYITYVKLRPGASAADLEAKFPAFIEKYAASKIREAGFYYVPRLQPISEIHLKSSDFLWDIARRGNEQMVFILSVTALLVLITACLNFVNLSTARAVRRMKEVGVRKVIGARRAQLIGQFLAESVSLTLFALVIAIAVTQLLIEPLNAFTGKSIQAPLNVSTFVLLGIAGILVGCVAGAYPAVFLSRFRPQQILGAKADTGGIVFRKSLVVVQFVFSLFLVINALVVIRQNDLLRNRDLGFTEDPLLVLKLPEGQLKNAEAAKIAYTSHANVISGTLSYGVPGDLIAGDGIIDAATGKNWSANMFIVDSDYIETLGMEMAAGRSFSGKSTADLKHGFILNETAAKSFGFGSPEEAIGKKVNWEIWGRDSLKRGEIIGVVKDFHFRSMREKVAPAVMHVEPDYFWSLTLRVRREGLPSTIEHLKTAWERADSEWPFEYSFVDKSFDDMYKNEEQLSKLLTFFTGFAIFVACLGLFGLVEYSVHQRAREVGIRKVFGASVSSLILLLVKSYFVLLGIAFVLVVPVSYLTSTEWLQNFAYRIDIGPSIFINAGLLIALISVLTVIFQSMKAAMANPVKSLKEE